MVSKVSRAAEEAREEVEGIVVLPRSTATLVLFDSVVSVLVVDLPRLVTAEDLVRLSYLDELLVCCLISPNTCQLRSLQLLAERTEMLWAARTYGFLSG